MRIIEQRFLRGPNLFAATPCLMAVVDAAGVTPAPGFGARLLDLLPGLPPEAAARVGGLACVADAVEPVVMELQRLAGAAAEFSQTLAVARRPNARRAVCGYRTEQVARRAFDVARDLLRALAAGETYGLDAALVDLRETAEDYAIGTSTGAVVNAALRRGIPALRITDEANLFQLGWGSKQKRLQATITGATNSIAVGIASDKQLTKTLLDQAGVPVPGGATVTTLAEAQRMARRLNGPATIKPLDANQGKGVTTTCTTPEEVEAAFAHARKYGRHVIVEEFLAGRDYRVLVTGTRIAAASWRRPPCVTGDGQSTVRELVEVENRNPARGEGHTNILTKIPMDALAESTLAKQGYGFDSILPAGVTVDLRGNANLSTGGTAEDVTDLLPEETRDICIRAARTIGLDVAGIDVICQDIAQPLREQGGGIIEVNAAPGIRMHQYPSRGTPRDAGAAIAEALFGQDDGRIPLIAVTGTNGKTTTSLLIAHAARLAGLRTGVTTTEGVYVDGQRVRAGDCTGYHSARSLLTSPDVDFAVLETARGGILKRGLAYDRCDVSVVLNVSSDHLGLDGIETVEELAKVKAVVAGRASRAVVLNAEDDYCVAMAKDLQEAVEVLYFALDADNPVLLRHLERGGRGVYLENNTVVLATGSRHEALLDVRDMPVSLGGCARYNIANALAATAALVATGFGNLEIQTGLCSFVSDSKHNPLRSNVFDVDGVTVIVDYAHNCAAYAALSETARAMTPGRVVGVVAAPGDRRDADLVDIGRVCAAGFDELIVYETENRGRAEGEVAALLVQGARLGRIAADKLACELNVHKAIRRGLALCQSGDVLVFGCGSSISELTEALRPTRPEIAQRIEAEAV
ncbi:MULTISPECIES: cyanophycin synthetase [unclassified Massilia]|uniref:cyanophycin synthetase n=1 Tax=unclassified Massilia TaxID=2609279 RepID=UPI0017814509|nr:MULTISPECIES: cyanophycin synthetase [unclassified Massilia]MBD8531819.1 cyanophycin synthetase [Massilia sp. CFBP 13647]MBD8675264.1 cyanophycin synthetase [Massilia sp. CFBP 13721]